MLFWLRQVKKMEAFWYKGKSSGKRVFHFAGRQEQGGIHLLVSLLTTFQNPLALPSPEWEYP